MSTFDAQKAQAIRCKCGGVAHCLITGFGWMCLSCFNEKVKELSQ